ncbi:MAG: 16S rRNA (adenine(1518)-N(6)/adenine(1519)-N(6))-dimethyltransferase RsmA [Verrucomicrobia bacterium]|jgi:16S rRNA (adenine1518-N6/adenine1519-N6)-dimethyltransferase|nr:16S rRNA (adenine(1518)-N(6)/adenine(1519)-N(6))-dimethyltransferase RsmA [Verrucomicrobiota bacterium]
MTLSEMRRLLETRGIQLTKSLGQNFLHDGNQLDRIIAAAELTIQDRVLEIGPGLGPLTGRLLEQAGAVLAVEKDARLVEVLKERFQPTDPGPATATESARARGLTLLHTDALDWLQQGGHDWSGWKMVSNLPYSVASPILVELCRGPRSPERIVATLQLEVAQRLTAGPRGRDYGILTLLVQLDYEPGRTFKIPAGCFFPRPDVDSACIVLRRRAGPLLPEALRPEYVRLVKRAFSQRRKQMLKLLKQDWETDLLAAAYDRVGLTARTRAEEVSLEQFAALTRLLAVPKGKAHKGISEL